MTSLKTRFVGPTWGPSGADRAQMGPMLAPWTLLSGIAYVQVCHESGLLKKIPILKSTLHDDVIEWENFPRYWPFVWGIHRSPVNSPHKGQWRGALMFSSIRASINGWINNREAGDSIHHCTHYDVTVMNQQELSACPRSACQHSHHSTRSHVRKSLLTNMASTVGIWVVQASIFKQITM